MAIRCAAKALIVKDGCLLLNKCRRGNGDVYFDLPGGGQRAFESMEDAVRREVMEETGIGVRIIRFAALAEEIYTSEMLRQKYPDIPCFILGHSMGSFLTRSLLIRYPGCVDGAVIMGSGWNSEAAIAGGRAFAGLLGLIKGKRSTSSFISNLAFGGYNKALSPNRTAFDWIAADEHVVDRYIADPKCGEAVTLGLFSDMLRGFHFNQSKANLAKMDPDTPILFIAGTDDPVGAMGRGVEKSHSAFLAAGVKDAQMILCPGLRHEILNEPSAPEAADAPILRWLEAHL